MVGSSLCFPNCYEPGATSGNNLFLNNTEHYLNCHIYPNNVPGTGVIESSWKLLQIAPTRIPCFSRNRNDNLFLNELNDRTSQSILNIYNLEGKILATPIKNQIILIEYEKMEALKNNFLRMSQLSKDNKIIFRFSVLTEI